MTRLRGIRGDLDHALTLTTAVPQLVNLPEKSGAPAAGRLAGEFGRLAVRRAPLPSRRRPSAARRLALPGADRLGRLARRLDDVMGEINHYLGALAIGLVVLNLTALMLLAPYLQLRRSAYFQTTSPACTSGAETAARPLDAAIH